MNKQYKVKAIIPFWETYNCEEKQYQFNAKYRFIGFIYGSIIIVLATFANSFFIRVTEVMIPNFYIRLTIGICIYVGIILLSHQFINLVMRKKDITPYLVVIEEVKNQYKNPKNKK